MEQINLIEAIKYISPASLSYTEWVNVGMALKLEGYDVSVWDEWSREDSRYHSSECEKKWQSFGGASSPVTGATIIQMAKEHGYTLKKEGHALDWDDVIGASDDKKIIDSSWVEAKEFHIPDFWIPEEQLIRYIETLFSSDENVGYVTKSYEGKEGRAAPTAGCWDRTAGQLIAELAKCKGDVGSVLGDYKENVGAWIRFNPLDGKGIKNENITDFRYALVEADDMELKKQNALIRELELPVATLVYSGKKSLHAVVRVDAPDYKEYRKRVEYLYSVCIKNGLNLDTQNKNPSRLSRMPGVIRNGQKQYLIDTNIGKKSWDEWVEWIESVNDNLPDFESLDKYENDLPELAQPLIDGILRQGHKMLVAGPSKAGKSFALIELCIAIAEGRKWLNFQCTQGKVLYVNLELDSASCIHRFYDVYKAMGIPHNSLKNIDIWNLRGRSVPMDKLAPKLIRRAEKSKFIAIVIDPIYKVITGDENSADQMANFCNQFDKVCTELGCAVIYCHHHSKGSQGDKRSMDRASGSGVFARDPDALLDLIELNLTDSIKAQEKNKAICQTCINVLTARGIDIDEEIGQDDMYSSTAMQKHCKELLDDTCYSLLLDDIEEAEKLVDGYTAWRIDGTLREFPKFPPLNVWFKYPAHYPDKTGSLKDLGADSFNSKKSPYKQNFSKKKTSEDRKQERLDGFDTAFNICAENGKATIEDLVSYTGASESTVKRRIKESGKYWTDGKNVGMQ